MPQKPTLDRPEVPLPSTRTEVGRAEESGLLRFWSDSVDPPTADQASKLEGYVVLPWKARLRINSA